MLEATADQLRYYAVIIKIHDLDYCNDVESSLEPTYQRDKLDKEKQNCSISTMER